MSKSSVVEYGKCSLDQIWHRKNWCVHRCGIMSVHRDVRHLVSDKGDFGRVVV